ncbi:stalk domain-containing protein [Chakrabartyella piscis]|uniref:stalk domain-containing protein n=1 Tax=Chakrabartyella piscis TaxID=2918914 RepID=UPI0029586869|nr:stalk domain-containing protein [Chakrabartyella piscis]
MKNTKKIFALGMAMTLVGGTVAYAEYSTMPIDTETTAVEDIVDAVEAASKYTTQTGTITSIEANEAGGMNIMMDNETGGLHFLLSPETVVVDRATGALILAEDLEADMEVSVIYDKNSPMGMSMPAYLGQVTALITNASEGNFAVGYFDADLVNMDEMLALNIDETAVIQSIQGTRMILTAEDVQEKEALVFFDTTTRSIPAQTTPSFILLLDKETSGEEDNYLDGPMADLARTDVEAIENEVVAELVPLRETATDLGFTVVWQGKDMPILMENDEYTFSIEMDSAKYLMNDEEMTAAAPAILLDGVMFMDKTILG